MKEGEGKNKGIRDAAITWCVRGKLCLVFKKKSTSMIFSPHSSAFPHIPPRHSKASLNEGKTKEEGGRMGGKAEARERQQRAGGGGCAVASSAAVILLLRGSAAEGCAEGRTVEKRGKGDWKAGEKGSAWAALQQLQLQQPVRKKGRQRKEGDGCRIALKGAFLCVIVARGEGSAEACVLPPDVF